MTVIRTFTHDSVTGVKVGKYNLADNSTVHIFCVGETVIDTGPPNDRKSVARYFEGRSVRQILLTHHHEDHSGNAAFLSRMTGAPVFAHPLGLELLREGFPIRMYQKVFWGSTPAVSPEPLGEAVATPCGHTLVPIHTPGHSPDHVCFLEPDRKWLFTGDLFLAPKVKMFRADEDLTGHLKSLKTILGYDFETLFCAHKGVVENGHGMLEKKLAYYLALIEEVRGMHAAGRTPGEITRALFGKKGLVGYISCNHMSSENLVRQCLSCSV
ncbi:MBL fold metallo-hydrolase [Desulfoluna spongiiphila]|uniref:Glyoxylase, beta-lactamase superfamily II n=1 Tax=Desulfoluna spongiiphila TaxID=419481 RepID=A0A1G5FX20_9BACT|nr:MBL fold metallo-hydrolase [Desulfoluna spongiiphila]SCY43410.1 Glyoxylase, beta-lactamase superfamily II [Desulfoluna spongiiphila]